MSVTYNRRTDYKSVFRGVRKSCPTFEPFWHYIYVPDATTQHTACSVLAVKDSTVCCQIICPHHAHFEILKKEIVSYIRILLKYDYQKHILNLLSFILYYN